MAYFIAGFNVALVAAYVETSDHQGFANSYRNLFVLHCMGVFTFLLSGIWNFSGVAAARLFSLPRFLL